MADHEKKIRDYFAGGSWLPELRALREILTGTDLVEEFKWRSPCYTWEGSNVVTLWRLKDHCGIAFFKGVLLDDPEDLLEAPGENSRSVRKMTFTDVEEIETRAEAIHDYVNAAIGVEKRGETVEFEKDDLDWPEELTNVFGEDPDYRDAFEALTPGRQRGWLLHFTGAKQSATRRRRIDKARASVVEGKGMHERQA